jgi:hypothetical protein
MAAGDQRHRQQLTGSPYKTMLNQKTIGCLRKKNEIYRLFKPCHPKPVHFGTRYAASFRSVTPVRLN